jgi:hypothetical protein
VHDVDGFVGMAAHRGEPGQHRLPGIGGVDGSLCTARRAVTATTSVKVPPVSMPMRAATAQATERASGGTSVAFALAAASAAASLAGRWPSSWSARSPSCSARCRWALRGRAAAEGRRRAHGRQRQRRRHQRQPRLRARRAARRVPAHLPARRRKGFVPAWFGLAWFGRRRAPLVAVLARRAAVLGHVFTPFLGFRGGKGVATATGVLFALDWQATG